MFSRPYTFILLLLICSFVPHLAQAQNYEDYYKDLANKNRACHGDSECVSRNNAEASAKGRAILNGSEDHWSSPEEVLALDNQQIHEMDLNELETAIKTAKLFRELDQAKNAINSPSRCGTFREKAIETKDALDQLNASIANKTSENYGRRAQEVKDANTLALKNYETCYAQSLAAYPLLKANNIASYDAHTRAYNDQVDFFDGIADLDAYIKNLEDKLNGSAPLDGFGVPDDAIASVSRFSGKVEMLPGGRGNRWQPVKRGTILRLSDHLRTAPDARARLVFRDRYQLGNAGPSVVNIGSNTEIVMEQFAVSLNDPPKRTGVIGLVRGALRAFTKNWGFKSALQIRTGTSLCGIRGTEVAISYDPDSNVAEYALDHGDAYIEVNGQQTSIKPRTSHVIKQGVVGQAQAVSDAQWSELVSSTGAGYAETLATAVNDNDSHTPAPAPAPKEAVTASSNTYDALATQAIKSDAVDFMNSGTASIVTGTGVTHLPPVDRTVLKKIEAVTETFLKALKKNKGADFAKTIGGTLQNVVGANPTNEMLKNWLDENKQRPKTYTVKCSLCEKVKTCQVLAYVETEQDRIGLGKDVLFTLQNMGPVTDDWRIVSSVNDVQSASGFKLKAPICRK